MMFSTYGITLIDLDAMRKPQQMPAFKIFSLPLIMGASPLLLSIILELSLLLQNKLDELEIKLELSPKLLLFELLKLLLLLLSLTKDDSLGCKSQK